MVNAQPNICPGEWDSQTPKGLWHTNGSFNLSHTTNLKRTDKIVDFAVPVDHKVKLIKNEKKDKYFDLARELKKL